MTSPLTNAISQKAPDELRDMLADASAIAQRARMEVEVIEEALSKASSQSNGARLSPQAIRERILGIIGELGPSQPKAVRQALGDDSINAYNALAQLVKEGKLVKRDGLYEFVSANGSLAGEPSADTPSLGLGGMGGESPWPPADGSGATAAPNQSE